jgi:glycosyltransferase involved in cell wall biosynthesis
MTRDPAETLRLAYLSGEYPRATDTFIQREIAGLRARGVEVLTCSVRRTDASHNTGAVQQGEQAATFHVLEHARRPLRLAGDHLTVLARSPKRWFGALCLAWKTRPPGLKAALWQLFYFAEAAVLTRHLQRRGVRHLHNHFADSSCSLAMLTSAMSGIPFSFTLHGPGIFYAPRHWRLDEKIARAGFVACISHFSRSQAMFFSDPRHWDKLRIVHCGVEPALYSRAPHGPGGPRLLFVGRLDAVKGVPLLLDAFARLLAAHPAAVLTIIGDGPHRAALERRARDLGGSVSFLGYRAPEAVAEALAAADMLVLPSFAEGVPVVLMEAMAKELGVVSTRVGGVPELVDEGITGFLVDPGSSEALAEAVKRYAADATAARGGKALGGRPVFHAHRHLCALRFGDGVLGQRKRDSAQREHPGGPRRRSARRPAARAGRRAAEGRLPAMGAGDRHLRR